MKRRREDFLKPSFLRKISFLETKKILAKYWQVFKVSLEEIFIWRLNFVLWRVRSVLQLLVLYFLWSVVFGQQENVFGYTQTAMFTYVLGTALMRSFSLSSRSVDVAGEIHQGILTNFLLRPVSYLSYWFTRDIADKVVNIAFVVVELSVIYLLLKPPIFIQTDLLLLIVAAGTAILAVFLFFFLSFLLSMTGFWVREVWAPRFLAMVFIEFLSGGFFPLDILPRPVFTFLQATPFPYIIFFPLKVYLGQLSSFQIVGGVAVLVFWMVVAFVAVGYVWAKGLRVYAAEGR